MTVILKVGCLYNAPIKTLMHYSKSMGHVYKHTDRTVKLMCFSGNHAMVRVSRCAPFVVAIKELREIL